MVTVRLKKGALQYFRSLARKNPREIHAYLVGKNVSPSTIRVDHFVYTELCEQTSCSVQPSEKAQKELAHWTIDNGLQIVGTIHSHPSWYPILSPMDHRGHVEEGHRISGVCSILNDRTKVYFWTSDSSLPAKITYV